MPLNYGSFLLFCCVMMIKSTRTSHFGIHRFPILTLMFRINFTFMWIFPDKVNLQSYVFFSCDKELGCCQEYHPRHAIISSACALEDLKPVSGCSRNVSNHLTWVSLHHALLNYTWLCRCSIIIFTSLIISYLKSKQRYLHLCFKNNLDLIFSYIQLTLCS